MRIVNPQATQNNVILFGFSVIVSKIACASSVALLKELCITPAHQLQQRQAICASKHHNFIMGHHDNYH